jgi:hypothetical protein
MRYILAAIFVCALGMPAVSALPSAGLNGLSMSKVSPVVQVAKHSRPRASRRGSSAGGIHPLVGSGSY